MRTLADCVVSGAIALLFMATTASAGQANRPSPLRTADDWVTTQIQAQYFLDPGIKARTINVATLNGIVTLSGDVNTAVERARAVEIAMAVDGVRNVVNNLTVSGEPQPAGTSGVPATPMPTDQPPPSAGAPQAPPTDASMTSDIRTRFAADPGLSLLDLDVRVEGGVVRLAGDVPDLASRTRAERLARGVPGVTEVRNALVIKR